MRNLFGAIAGLLLIFGIGGCSHVERNESRLIFYTPGQFVEIDSEGNCIGGGMFVKVENTDDVRSTLSAHHWKFIDDDKTAKTAKGSIVPNLQRRKQQGIEQAGKP